MRRMLEIATLTCLAHGLASCSEVQPQESAQERPGGGTGDAGGEAGSRRVADLLNDASPPTPGPDAADGSDGSDSGVAPQDAASLATADAQAAGDSSVTGEPDAQPVALDAGPDATAGEACVFTGERVHSHDSEAPPHVDEPLAADEYNSDPPSSGPHCAQWGRYAIFGPDAPLPACNFVHNLEHGAIVLLYNCPDGCPELVGALEALYIDPPADPDCPSPRIVLTPYAEMQAKVAAAAWGYTWTSDCYDDGAQASLRQFMSDHIGTRGDSPEPTVCDTGSVAP